MFEALQLEQVVAVLAIFLFTGFGLLTAFVLNELRFIKKAIAVILAANPKLAQEVTKFEKEEQLNIQIGDDEE